MSAQELSEVLSGMTHPGVGAIAHDSDDEEGVARIDCPVCGGGGWIYREVPLGHPHHGRLFPCFVCQRDALLDDLLRKAGLEPDYLPPPLAEIRPASQAQQVAMAALNDTLARGWGFVFLWGTWGTGKTFLAEAAVRTFVEMGLETEALSTAGFWTLPDLMAHFRDKVKSGEVHRLQTELQHLPLLVLDEVDKLQGTAFTREQFFTLVDKRYRAATRLKRGVTIFTANVPPEKVSEGAGYFASRVRDKRFYVVPFPGEDLRRK